MATASQATFPGFQFPNTTQIPNEVFDTLMSRLSGGELKVLLYICRRTFGFRKDSDSISLTQIAHGITTKAGRVLDQGTGLSKRHVINALKTLEKRNIIKVSRTMDEAGLHEVNIYSLNLLDAESGVGTKSPQGVMNPTSPGVVNSPSPGVVHSSAPTKQREQKKEEQKKDIVVDVAQDLEGFGIAKPAVVKLTQRYPAQYIREKLEMAKGLVSAGSALVSQNPAGWLRRAIEEDYTLPKTSERHRQRSGREKQYTKLTQAKSRQQHTPEKESQPARNVATGLAQFGQNVVTHTRENIPEKKESEKTSRENELIWQQTVEKVQEGLPASDMGEAAAKLSGTALLEVTETAARILVPNPFAIPWLERRLYGQIAKAIKGLVGKDVDLQFIACS
jgi:phage replication O-like protein O